MKLLRILALGVGGLVALVVVLVAALAAHGYSLLAKKTSNPVPALAVAPDSALVARGRHISDFLCQSCHGSDAPGVLSGGREDFGRIPGGPVLGTIHAPNLTPAGRVGRASDGEVARAIREGVGFDGKPLVVMPSASLRTLSDRDLAALIAFLRTQPAVPDSLPARRLNLLGLLVLGTHMFETSHQLPVDRPVPDVPAGPTPEYGAYVAAIADCRTCHGPALRGGIKGQLPPVGPDIVAVAKAHPLPAFSGALREGKGADGRALNPALMPWPGYAHLHDVEVAALWAYLRSL